MTVTRYPRIPIPPPARPRSFIFSSTIDQRFALGTKLELDDGRVFRYCENGAAILYKALMAQSAVPVAGWTEITQTGKAATVGDTTYAGLISTAVTANDWDEGWMMVVDGHAASIGDTYQISSHTVHATAPTVTIADPGGIRTTFDATAEISFIKNMYKDVIVVPAGAATAVVAGVPLVDIPIDYYGWIQRRGPCPLIIDADNVVVGDQVGETATAGVAGGAGIHAATYPIWGTVISEPTAGQTTDAALVDLCLE